MQMSVISFRHNLHNLIKTWDILPFYYINQFDKQQKMLSDIRLLFRKKKSQN